MPRAVTYARTGGPEVLQVSDVPLPEPGPGEVRIKVAAASANLVDSKLRRGLMPFPQRFPVTPGIDAAGVVEAVGEGAPFAVGDSVFGTGRATYAESAILTTAERKPDSVDDLAAAAVATTGETAFRGLAQTGVQAGGTVVIHGAAGGVGELAMQLAVRQGITVVGTCAPSDFEFVRSLGGTPVAYGEGWVDRVRQVSPEGVDGVFDTAGAGVLPESVQLTGYARTVVTIADPHAEQVGVRFSGGNLAERRFDSYPMLAQLLADGDLTVRVAKTYRLDEVQAMHEALDRGGNPGKLILVP